MKQRHSPLPLIRDMVRDMVRIRCVEEELATVYREEQEMRTPVHFSIGQEATAVGVCAALRRTDVIYSGHRCHAQFLAKGGDLLGMVAELHGRENGCSAGRGGSVHLADQAAGFGASSAILGEMISVATGAAWAFARRGESRVAVTFFGDGASEEGVFHESLNFAAVHRLPVVFVCENNQYSLSSPLTARQPSAGSISGRARGYGIPARRLDGNDVGAVFEAAREAVADCRDGKGPWFLEFDTYRWREHVGPDWDYDVSPRSKNEIDSWIARCPIRRAVDFLSTSDSDIEADVSDWERTFRAEVHEAVAEARASPFPAVEHLLAGTYES
ncbi:thiamine pyrophosphate-dependent dehydrogenase E1 component subunit alpha [Streptomyces sp. NPDC088116]|uniref:thiamine pyrophosphate-dependent dehydrogenase E1 component subunit alpha n=1 Tax=Streptomyces sp. NPDC088116 TaxID=3365825 RepID=UPI00381F0512